MYSDNFYYCVQDIMPYENERDANLSECYCDSFAQSVHSSKRTAV